MARAQKIHYDLHRDDCRIHYACTTERQSQAYFWESTYNPADVTCKKCLAYLAKINKAMAQDIIDSVQTAKNPVEIPTVSVGSHQDAHIEDYRLHRQYVTPQGFARNTAENYTPLAHDAHVIALAIAQSKNSILRTDLYLAAQYAVDVRALTQANFHFALPGRQDKNLSRGDFEAKINQKNFLRKNEENTTFLSSYSGLDAILSHREASRLGERVGERILRLVEARRGQGISEDFDLKVIPTMGRQGQLGYQIEFRLGQEQHRVGSWQEWEQLERQLGSEAGG